LEVYQEYPKESENSYSQFYLDLLEALSKPGTEKKLYSIVIKFTNLIYKEFWIDIFKSIENNE
jgi:hypothetical protein